MVKLEKHRMIRGILICETGLRIGGTKDDIEIGGMENPIIRNPVTGLPYVPGSSIKGRMRSLLELKYSAETQRSGQPCRCAKCDICRVFGPHKAQSHELGPTRLIVRDANLTSSSEDILRQAQLDKGLNFSEVKSENWIDRKTGRAGDPRTQERVPAGTEFQVELVIREFQGDTDAVIKLVREGLSLVQKEYLGGSGSRGYGKVRFVDLTLDGEPFSLD